jgi:hypothetical protein
MQTNTFYSEIDFYAVTRKLHPMQFGGAEFLFTGMTPKRVRDITRHPELPQSNSDVSYVRTKISDSSENYEELAI